MQLTDAQRRAVQHRGSSAIVSASAGSGKTEVLAQRCVAYLADPAAPGRVERLLVVTFTRAAAAELRVRIGRMLREAATAATAPALRDHLLRQCARIDGADIGTIDAWCQRILRAHFVEAAIDPGFAILGEDEAGLLRQQVLQQTFDWIYESAAEPAAAARNWIAAQSRPTDEFLRGAVRELNRFRERLVDPEAWLAAQRDEWSRPADTIRTAAAGQLAGALRVECARQAAAVADLCADLGPSTLAGKLGKHRDQLEAWAALLRDPDQLTAVTAEIDGHDPRPAKTYDEREAQLHREARNWFTKRIRNPWKAERVERVLCQPALLGQRLRTLLAVEAEYDRGLREAKLRRGVLEFGDVLRRTHALLREGDHPDGLTSGLRSRYDLILIDEYQDTSPVQVALFRLLSRTQPGNRLMVGDLKQSIYGFRDADPTEFIRQQEAFESGAEAGQVLPLQDNFRSNAALVARFNDLFAQLFEPGLGGITFDDQQCLQARREEADNPDLAPQRRFRVSALAEPGRGQSMPTDAAGIPYEQTEVEGFEIARQIRALRAAGTCKSVRVGSGETRLEPIGYGDIVILLRSAKFQAAQIAEVLRRQDIPVMIAGHESILDSPEVTDLRTILRLLGSRRLDLEIAAFLRGPVVALREKDLLAIRRAAPTLGFSAAALRYARDGADTDLAATIREAFRKLARWRRSARVLELPQLLRQILRESGLELFALGLPGGEHRTAVLAALLSMAERFAASQARGPSAFVQYLDALFADQLKPEVNVATRGDVVRIMTIHMSKGLEFPVVFLAGAGSQLSKRTGGGGGLFCDHDAGIGLQTFDVDLRRELATPAQIVGLQTRTEAELSEELRLLYVAATRAREVFHVTGFVRADLWSGLRARAQRAAALPLLTRLTTHSVLEWVLGGIACAASGPDAFSVEVCDPQAVVASAPPPSAAANDLPPADDSDRAWIAASEELLARQPDLARARQPAAVSVSALKSAADGDAQNLRGHATLAPPAFAATGTSGQRLGTLVHRFLEQVAFEELADAAQVQAAAARLVAQQRILPEAAALLPIDDLAWFGGTELCRALQGAQRVWREQAFAFPLPADDPDDRVLVRGVLDCLVQTSAGLHLLDYKTDRFRDAEQWAERCARYTRQLQVYALAINAARVGALVSADLVFLQARRVQSVDVSPQVLRNLAGDLQPPATPASSAPSP